MVNIIAWGQRCQRVNTTYKLCNQLGWLVRFGHRKCFVDNYCNQIARFESNIGQSHNFYKQLVPPLLDTFRFDRLDMQLPSSSNSCDSIQSDNQHIGLYLPWFRRLLHGICQLHKVHSRRRLMGKFYQESMLNRRNLMNTMNFQRMMFYHPDLKKAKKQITKSKGKKKKTQQVGVSVSVR